MTVPLAEMLFRTAVACRIVGIDRDRFNEAIASGVYPCAPPTNFGQARILRDYDVIGLDAFNRFTSTLSIHQKRAGAMACELVSAVRTSPNEDYFVVIFDSFGSIHAMPAAEFKLFHRREGTHYPGMGPIVDVLLHDVGMVREKILRGVEHENRFVGGFDPEDR